MQGRSHGGAFRGSAPPRMSCISDVTYSQAPSVPPRNKFLTMGLLQCIINLQNLLPQYVVMDSILDGFLKRIRHVGLYCIN